MLNQAKENQFRFLLSLLRATKGTIHSKAFKKPKFALQ